MRLRMILPVALMLMSIQGCAVCTDIGIFAIRVQVQDSETGGQIASTPIGIVAYGENRDTLYASRTHVLTGGPIEPGTYDVEITAEGYRTWNRKGVEVEMQWDGCHVVTVELEAGMVLTAPRLP